MTATARMLLLLLLAGFCAQQTGCARNDALRMTGRQNHASYVPGEVSNRPVDVRVMSFNLRRPVVTDLWNHWAFRRNRAVAGIAAVAPDILGTQEATPGMVRFLRSKLDGFDHVAAGRNTGGLGWNAGESTAVFFNTHRFALRDSGHFWFGDAPDTPGRRAWGAWWPRMCTWARLREHHSGRELVVLNAHLSAVSRTARARSAAQLRDAAAAIAGELPVIVTGDFNAGEHDLPFGELTADGALTDTFRAVHADRAIDTAAEGTHHGFGQRTRGHRIDWILTSAATTDRNLGLAPRLVPTAAGILHQRFGRGPLSDHFPVVADLAWADRDAMLFAEATE